jgi:integrase
VSYKQTGRPRGVPYIDIADNGVYYVHWSDGRRSKRESLGTREIDEATARFADWIQLGVKDRHKAVDRGALTIDDLWKVYDAKHVQTDAVVPSGRATIGYAWKNLQSYFGASTLKHMNQMLVDGYIDGRRWLPNRHTGLLTKIGRKSKDITIRRELATLTAALNFCATAAGGRLIGKADIETIAMPHPGQPRDRWLTEQEMQALLGAAARSRRQTAEERAAGKPARMSRVERFLWLALFTAARKQAILDLTWDRVHFDTGVIHYEVPGRQRTKKRRASVPIATQLRVVLEAAYAERTGPYVLDHKGDTLWSSIQFVAMAAGLSGQDKVKRGASPKASGISPHVLRHTAATHMARRGVPLWIIAKILGNTLAMVEKVYAKWVPENPAGTVDLIYAGVLEAAE